MKVLLLSPIIARVVLRHYYRQKKPPEGIPPRAQVSRAHVAVLEGCELGFPNLAIVVGKDTKLTAGLLSGAKGNRLAAVDTNLENARVVITAGLVDVDVGGVEFNRAVSAVVVDLHIVYCPLCL